MWCEMVEWRGLFEEEANGELLRGQEGFKASPEMVLISNRLQVWLLPDSPFWVDH